MREVAAFYKVLADEARLKMLWLLLHHRELCVCDFTEVLKITQSKASRHLRILYHAGLVADRRDGLWVYYRLNPLRDRLAKSNLESIRTHLTNHPEAAQLLKRLSAWLRSKGAAISCAGNPVSRTEGAIKAGTKTALPPGGPQ